MNLNGCSAGRLSSRAGVVLIIVALLAGTNASRADDWDDATLLERAPGRLVDVGGHRLHIDCAGTGQPAVILDAGIGGFSLEWEAVRAALPGHIMVCAYDRAGYGWSDPGPSPRTASRNADELHALLQRAGVPPPYVLVGHSFGGFDIRLFAARHPAKVAGMVLVDSSNPDQFERLPAAALPAPSVGRPGSLIRPAVPTGLGGDAQLLAFRLMLLPKGRAAVASELAGFRASATEVGHAGGLGDRPLVVVSRGRAVFGPTGGGEAAEAVWASLQSELLDLSRNSARLVAGGAGHVVHADRPDVVARAIRATVWAARTERPVAAFAPERRGGAYADPIVTALAGIARPLPATGPPRP